MGKFVGGEGHFNFFLSRRGHVLFFESDHPNFSLEDLKSRRVGELEGGGGWGGGKG